MTIQRLIAIRDRLNAMGEPTHYFTESAHDTIPGNRSTWNRKRIRIRNKINARLRALGA